MSRNEAFITRRKFIIGGTSVILLTACGQKPTGTNRPQSTPGESASTGLITPERWTTISAAARLQVIEQRGLNPARYPEKTQFDPLQELTKASAEAYCEQIKCKLSPTELAAAVLFVDTTTFLNTLENDIGRTLTSSERQQQGYELMEFVEQKNRKKIYLNQEGFNLRRQEDFTAGRITPTTQGRDTITKYLEHTLFHAFSHVNSHMLEKDIPPLSLAVSDAPSPVIFTHMKGFHLIGKDATGKETIFTGADEAATDYVARYAELAKTGLIITSGGPYRNGALMIGEINQRAGISYEEFVRYHNELPIDELLKKWGSIKDPKNPNIIAALQALAVIGVQTQVLGDDAFMRTAVASLLYPAHPNSKR